VEKEDFLSNFLLERKIINYFLNEITPKILLKGIIGVIFQKVV
jgi:hypothetical protein